MKTLEALIAARYGEAAEDGATPPPDDAVAGLLGRRSIRAYTDEPVPESLLRALLACAQSAPTKSNLQQYSIVVVGDPAQRARLAPLCRRTAQIETAPLLLVFCADARRRRRASAARPYPRCATRSRAWPRCWRCRKGSSPSRG